MKQSIEQRFSVLVDTQKQSGRYRTLETNTVSQGRTINVGGKNLLNFCSNDYLGLCDNPNLKCAAIEAIKLNGVGAGAAALLSGRHAIHEQLEQKLATYTGYEAALIFSSGYLANLGLISALANRHDEIHHDKLNHASLIDAVKLSGAHHKRFSHADITQLDRNLSLSAATQKWVLTDGVFSMDGDLAPLDKIAAVSSRHNAILVVDDAHGFGVLGNGKGTCSHYGLTADEAPVVVVTFGKALGSAGAAVLGPKTLIEFLIQTSRTFIYDTALPPALAASTLAAIELIESDAGLIESLNKNIIYFKNQCKTADIPISPSSTPIQPLIVGDEARAVAAAKKLLDIGIYVRAVRPPTVPVGTSRLRICLSAAHKFSDIDKLVQTLKKSFAAKPNRKVALIDP